MNPPHEPPPFVVPALAGPSNDPRRSPDRLKPGLQTDWRAGSGVQSANLRSANPPPTHRPTTPGFTLIELLVVIAIIAILAGLLLPVGAGIMKKAAKTRARAELLKVDMAINAYKTKLGFYPPDNTNNPALNTLYDELLGAAGAVNSSVGSGSDDGTAAQSFLKEVQPEVASVRRLGVGVDGPIMFGNINPFRYNATNPTNNVNSFDLWVDVTIGGKTWRISNWSVPPQIVP